MRAAVREAVATGDRATLASLFAICGMTLVTTFAVVTQAVPPKYVAPLMLVSVLLAITARRLVRWRSLVASLPLCILIIPIRRYSLPGGLPFQLEPYRILVATVTLAWGTSLLIDRRVRARRSPLDGPLLAIFGAYLLSDIANGSRIGTLGINSYVIKAITFFISFLLIYYIVVSLTRTEGDLDALIKVFVGGAAFVGLSAMVENRTHYNVFDHLHTIFPVLHFAGLSWGDLHDNRVRAMGSAEHPIALGAGLALILPLGLYLARKTGKNRWLVATAFILLGVLASRSRTAILMLIMIGLVFLWLRPRQVRRYWPALIPLFLVAQVAMPGLSGTLKESFFPKGGLVAQQAQGAGTYGSGRVADLGPGLHEFSQHPLSGVGFGTRITDRADPNVNANILDDQLLGTALEVGILGFGAWIWLFGRSIRRLARAAKAEQGPRGLLFVAVAASVAAYAESMATYDSFAFIQEVFILFLVLAIGAVALLQQDERLTQPSPATAIRRYHRAALAVLRPRRAPELSS
jgi:polysaccharide biosynthesis protein PslJ